MAVGRSKGTVGVVGLGKMGGAFAKHLVAGGWRVLGYDIDAGRNRAAARAGVEIAPNASTLANPPPRDHHIAARSRRTGCDRRRDHQGEA
jgi:3-hydroxyacyl-CoA dehydrogenase